MTEQYATAAVRLTRFASLLVDGPDARAFLQGQLSADLEQLAATRVQLASCNSVQGRVQAVVWLVERSDAFVLVLPAPLIETIAGRLRKYVLRSKVRISTGAGKLDAYVADRTAVSARLDEPRAHYENGAVSYIRWPGDPARVLMLAPDSTASVRDANAEVAWHLEDVRAGLPQVYPVTHEAFVAQMLNLDLLGGIDYEKGCYTGQEIIARTHFRGTIKRRMLRFASDSPPPDPGTRIVVGDQHAGDVVDAATTAGGCELLAVVSLSQADARLEIDGQPRSVLRRMPLPYSVTSSQ